MVLHLLKQVALKSPAIALVEASAKIKENYGCVSNACYCGIMFAQGIKISFCWLY